MKIGDKLQKLIAVLVVGSGLVNIISASGRPLPLREKLLTEFFPLDFLRLSNFLTLILGIALGILGLNLYRRKEKAVTYAILLSGFSVIFHLTKGLDYEEAIYSLIVMGILFRFRKSYRVKSAGFNFRQAAVNILVAFVMVVIYGILGFWFFDKREFGINFSVRQAIIQTAAGITFTSTGIVPRTHFARFFVNSLQAATILVLGYTFSMVFAPVLYILTANKADKNRARELLAKYGNSALDYFKIQPDKDYFFPKQGEAFTAYAVSSGTAVSLGDPTGEKEAAERTIGEFDDFCTQNGWRCCFLQVTSEYLKIYKDRHFRSFDTGDEAIVELAQFTLEGKEGKKFRNTVNKFEKEGYTSAEINSADEDTINRLKEVSDSWLLIKGRKERTFSLGFFDPGYLKKTLVFAVKNNQGQITAFVNLIPSGVKGELAVDLMRHPANPANGLMDFLFIKLILHLREIGFTRLSLGLAPLSGSKWSKNADFIFSFQGLKAFKAKFAHIWEPRYLMYKNLLDLPVIAKGINELMSNIGYQPL